MTRWLRYLADDVRDWWFWRVSDRTVGRFRRWRRGPQVIQDDFTRAPDSLRRDAE